MSSMIIPILLLISFFAFIVFILKGGNLTIGLFVMAIIWSIIGLVPFNTAIKKVFTEPALNYGPTIIYIIFGSWFGRVLVESGIASSISEETNKIGKNKPLISAILVLLVTSFIFVSAYGVGSVIAIGVILLPILLSIGIPRDLALTTFCLAIGAPMYVNVVLFNQIKPFFPSVTYDTKYLSFGWIAAIVQIVFVILLLILNRKKIDITKAHENLEIIGAETGDNSIKKVSKFSYIVPIIPVAMNMLFKWDAVPALTLATIIAMILTNQMSNYKKFVSFLDNTIKKSISDIAGLIMFLMALTMFTGAASINASQFKPLFSAILPHSHLLLAIIFGVLAPLALFRGPLHVWGAGAATAAVLSGTHLFSDYFLLPLLLIPSLLAISTDVTQSWNIWGLDYMKVDTKSFLKYGVPVMWIVSIINEIIAYFFFG
ncbi:gluconate:proton symporter [Bombilactobacillus bombi]|uniref:gluconate:proton symporter n=1 Tax=Bombilactobacillus bombi TaxID=1303590 RepID=UPI000E572D8C|nr:gluconate:proton symporter [Bombilactobacillus bombi]AXX65087.1 gluconate:proton symporter [Bombilactobacillus bombi]